MTTATCIHHYVYPLADGPVSVGVCKHCGQADTAKNYLDVGGETEMGMLLGRFNPSPSHLANSAEANKRNARRRNDA